MRELKKIITTAVIGLVLTAGSAAVAYAHDCPDGFWSGNYYCWYNHGVSPVTGKHVCNINCDKVFGLEESAS